MLVKHIWCSPRHCWNWAEDSLDSDQQFMSPHSQWRVLCKTLWQNRDRKWSHSGNESCGAFTEMSWFMTEPIQTFPSHCLLISPKTLQPHHQHRPLLKRTEGISESAAAVWLVTSLLKGWLQKHQSKLMAWALLLSYRSLIKGFYILIQNPLLTIYTIYRLQHRTICPTPDLPCSFEALWGYEVHTFQMVTRGYI